ncbi:hypothetical protein BKA56DRAFT_91640 [Ilyonectria sp. MPI-CAGE-AT-0026]|nr:hypothetical protein BKA56DRAFT_91640 [Ilyonectria sp. MPI-CAGE-AT-0026]
MPRLWLMGSSALRGLRTAISPYYVPSDKDGPAAEVCVCVCVCVCVDRENAAHTLRARPKREQEQGYRGSDGGRGRLQTGGLRGWRRQRRQRRV